MSGTANLVAVCIVVAFAMTTSASAQTEQRRPTGPAVGPTQGGTMAPPSTTGKPTGPTRPVIGGKTPLTEGECTQLGGQVGDAAPGTCNSGKVCHTVDENKHSHNVCISRR